MGFRFNLGIETEFFVLRRDAQGRAVPLSPRDTLDKPAYDVRTLLDNLPWLDELVSAMNQLGWGCIPSTMKTVPVSSRSTSIMPMRSPWPIGLPSSG